MSDPIIIIGLDQLALAKIRRALAPIIQTAESLPSGFRNKIYEDMAMVLLAQAVAFHCNSAYEDWESLDADAMIARANPIINRMREILDEVSQTWTERN